jgi:hypothetical protein
MTPTGGPDDHTAPMIMATVPASGSLNVDRHAPVEIAFSEWILGTTAMKAVSILPPVEKGVRIHVSGKRLSITPATAFADSTTYHVVITAALLDLHNIPLTTAYSLVFSTGPKLDSGTIAGCVVDQTQPRRETATIGLYRATDGEETDTAVFRNPDYLTQTDSAGFFSLDHLHKGVYRIVAFIDKNGNRRLDPGIEVAYAPVRRSIAVTGKPDTVTLFPAASDTATPKLESVRPLSSKYIICKWSAPLDSLRGFGAPSWRIEQAGAQKVGPQIASTVWIGEKKTCALMLSDSLSRQPYSLLYSFTRRRCGASTVIADTTRFNGVSVRDTILPALQSVAPGGMAPLLPEIRLLFTKPVTLTAPLALIDSLHDTVRLKGAQGGYADTIALVPDRRLRAETRFRLTILRGSAKDLAGNPLKVRDTTDTVAAPVFSTLASDSIALSLRGCRADRFPDPRRKWRFLPFTGAPPQPVRDSAGCFRFDSLAASKGLIGWFIDNNNNNLPDQGTLLPFTAPEPSFIAKDTVEARARWEIEGISTPLCDRCQPLPLKPAVPPKKEIGKK